LLCPFRNPAHIPRQHLSSRLPADDTGSDEEIFEVSEKNWKTQSTNVLLSLALSTIFLIPSKAFPEMNTAGLYFLVDDRGTL
jgi:hypothetical protein